MGEQRETEETLESETQEYRDFVEKFKPKKTTDDCYTPANIYAAVAAWVAEEYGLEAKNFVRPFWPGGDFEHFDYPEECVVVDNPPFSILKKIVETFKSRGIRFFLFCPALTPPKLEGVTVLATGNTLAFENGAEIGISFVTDLEPGYVLRSAPELYQVLAEENKKNLAKVRRSVPKYVYPDHVITAALAQRYSRYGVAFRVRREDAARCSKLDAQREKGKEIFGTGWLLSEKAAAEKAAAEKAAAEKAAAEKADCERWQLSEREWEIVRNLGRDGP